MPPLTRLRHNWISFLVACSAVVAAYFAGVALDVVLDAASACGAVVVNSGYIVAAAVAAADVAAAAGAAASPAAGAAASAAAGTAGSADAVEAAVGVADAAAVDAAAVGAADSADDGDFAFAMTAY